MQRSEFYIDEIVEFRAEPSPSKAVVHNLVVRNVTPAYVVCEHQCIPGLALFFFRNGRRAEGQGGIYHKDGRN